MHPSKKITLTAFPPVGSSFNVDPHKHLAFFSSNVPAFRVAQGENDTWEIVDPQLRKGLIVFLETDPTVGANFIAPFSAEITRVDQRVAFAKRLFTNSG